jgi:hypothetical protein
MITAKERCRLRNAAVRTSLQVISFLIVETIASAQIPPADWKLYGFSIFGSGGSYLFYSNGDLRRLPNGHIEVWTKGLSEKAVEKAENAPPSKEFMERVYQKFKREDALPYSKIQKLTPEQRMNSILSEEFANDANIQPNARILFELDCPGHLSRSLSMYFHIAGKTEFDDKAHEWEHIAPETTTANLTALLCPAG